MPKTSIKITKNEEIEDLEKLVGILKDKFWTVDFILRILKQVVGLP